MSGEYFVTAELRNWTYDVDNNIYWGNIYNDLYRRWKDGTTIVTSKVLSRLEFENSFIIITAHNVYRCYKSTRRQ